MKSKLMIILGISLLFTTAIFYCCDKIPTNSRLQMPKDYYKLSFIDTINHKIYLDSFYLNMRTASDTNQYIDLNFSPNYYPNSKGIVVISKKIVDSMIMYKNREIEVVFHSSKINHFKSIFSWKGDSDSLVFINPLTKINIEIDRNKIENIIFDTCIISIKKQASLFAMPYESIKKATNQTLQKDLLKNEAIFLKKGDKLSIKFEFYKTNLISRIIDTTIYYRGVFFEILTLPSS